MAGSRLFPSDRPRAKVAAEVWERLRAGPSFAKFGNDEFTPAEAQATYRRWAQSWILTEVARLVPELREKLNDLGYVPEEGQ